MQRYTRAMNRVIGNNNLIIINFSKPTNKKKILEL